MSDPSIHDRGTSRACQEGKQLGTEIDIAVLTHGIVRCTNSSRANVIASAAILRSCASKLGNVSVLTAGGVVGCLDVRLLLAFSYEVAVGLPADLVTPGTDKSNGLEW